jgi:biotin-(acetyl-CoA carboxylase) ligase
VEHAIIGFGINVNHTSADLPKELLLAARSLFIERGEPVDRSKLLTKILTEVENALESAFPVATRLELVDKSRRQVLLRG